MGKSVVSRLLAQYYIDREIPFQIYDGDLSHGAMPGIVYLPMGFGKGLLRTARKIIILNRNLWIYFLRFFIIIYPDGMVLLYNFIDDRIAGYLCA